MSAVLKNTELPPLRMTVAEFFVWSDDSDPTRYELVDGEPRAMAPTTTTHGILQATLARLVGNHLVGLGRKCRAVIAPGVQPRVRADLNFRSPDLGVMCAPDEPATRFVGAPVVLVEILSPSNERDTWQNVWAYVSIPSVREILVLRIVEIGAELLRRQPDGSWPERPQSLGPDDDLILESIGFQAPLAEVYADTHLATVSR